MAKSTAKSSIAVALEYLARPEKYVVPGVVAVFGDDAYLKREVLTTLRRAVLGGGDSEFSLTTLSGATTQLRDVRDGLATVSLFGGGRQLVVVDEADEFVSRYRSELEDEVSRLAHRGGSPAPGPVLVLVVDSWPTNTRLAKAVAASGLTIDCKSPNERQMKSWLVERAKAMYQVRLEAATADAILELIPPELGLLAQELDKLALVVDERRVIDAGLVREHVGGWRTRAVWDMVDAVADGLAAEAIAQLDRLIAAGEKPQGLLPQLASTLRRFDAATRLIEVAETERRSLPLRDALAQAGVLHFKLADAERQLRRIGRQRAKQLTRWVLAADLAIKSHNSADDAARLELERLITRVASGA